MSGARWRGRSGVCRPITSTFSSSTAPIRTCHRGCGRHGKGVHSGGQSQARGPVGRDRGDNPPGPRRPAGLRRAKRVRGMVARARNDDFSTLEELGIGFVPYCPFGSGLPDRRHRRERPLRPAGSALQSPWGVLKIESIIASAADREKRDPMRISCFEVSASNVSRPVARSLSPSGADRPHFGLAPHLRRPERQPVSIRLAGCALTRQIPS